MPSLSPKDKASTVLSTTTISQMLSKVSNLTKKMIVQLNITILRQKIEVHSER